MRLWPHHTMVLLPAYDQWVSLQAVLQAGPALQAHWSAASIIAPVMVPFGGVCLRAAKFGICEST